MGVVHHPAGQGRELWPRRRLGAERRRQKEGEDQAPKAGQAGQARQAGHLAAGVDGGGEPGAAPATGDGGLLVSKLTVGADWAAAEAENSGMGFSLL
jgi:hypothetical protein